MTKNIETQLGNIYFKLRYNLFKKCLKKKDFSNRELIFYDDFHTLDNFDKTDKEFYNDNSVWFSKDAIYLTSEGLLIKCYEDKRTHTSWQGTRDCTHTSGIVTTKNKFTHSNGVWVINAKICDSWCAIWLLKNDRYEPIYTKTQITPEIDIMEAFKSNKSIKHTIHYGYSDIVYKTDWIGTGVISKGDDKFHDFAVEILNNGYNFYIDGIQTGRFRSNDPDYVTDYPNYLLLNNSSDSYTTKNTEFIVKSVKVFK